MDTQDLVSVVRATDVFAPVESLLARSYSRFCISTELARVLARLVVLGGCRRVLEFGSGLSSLILAESLSVAGGGRLTAVEHQPHYSRDMWLEVSQRSGVDSKLIAAPLRLILTRAGVGYGYPSAHRWLAARGPYDLIFVDAPPNAFGRDAALWQAHRHLSENALILLDDAARRREQATIDRWLRQYPGLRLAHYDPAFGGRGLALLQHRGASLRNLDLSGFFTTVRERYRSRAKLR